MSTERSGIDTERGLITRGMKTGGIPPGGGGGSCPPAYTPIFYTPWI